ncbi:MAG: hypothetical protein JO027_02470, partial [Solirubrobacterales bacterium]|nr:hypothetical protein [Solirubrobacterales bacterium]
MHRKHLLALGAATLAVCGYGSAVSLAAASGPAKVTIRVEGRTRTLLGPR